MDIQQQNKNMMVVCNMLRLLSESSLNNDLAAFWNIIQSEGSFSNAEMEYLNFGSMAQLLSEISKRPAVKPHTFRGQSITDYKALPEIDVPPFSDALRPPKLVRQTNKLPELPTSIPPANECGMATDNEETDHSGQDVLIEDQETKGPTLLFKSDPDTVQMIQQVKKELQQKSPSKPSIPRKEPEPQDKAEPKEELEEVKRTVSKVTEIDQYIARFLTKTNLDLETLSFDLSKGTSLVVKGAPKTARSLLHKLGGRWSGKQKTWTLTYAAINKWDAPEDNRSEDSTSESEND